MRYLIRFVAVTTLSIASFFSFSQAQALPEVDLIYNVSGAYSSPSKSAWHGAHIAADMLKKNGHEINLVLYNGQSNKNMNHAIGQMRASRSDTIVFIGLGNSELVKAAAKPVLSHHKIFISASSLTQADLTSLGKLFFSLPPTKEVQADTTLDFVNQYFRLPQLLVMYNQDSSSSVERLNALKKQSNLTVVAINTATPTPAVWVNQLKSYNSSLNKAIIVLASDTGSIKQIRQIRESGVTLPVVATTLLSQQQLAEHQLAKLSPVFFLTPNHNRFNPTVANEFVSHYRAVYHKMPSAAAFEGYNAVMLAGHAIISYAKSNHVEAVAGAIRHLMNTQGTAHSPMIAMGTHQISVLSVNNQGHLALLTATVEPTTV